MCRLGRIYKAYLKINWLVNLEYRLNVITGLAGIATLNLVDIALIGFVLSRFEAIGGWSFWEIVFLTFFYILVLGFENMFAVHILYLENHIRDGTFDRFLVRPVPPLVQLLGQQLTLRYVDHLVLGGIGIGLTYVNLDLHWSWGQWIMFGVALLSSVILLGAFVLALSSLAFWTVRSSPFVFSTMEIQEAVQHYPITIFGRSFVFAVTFVLPFAFMNYYPALILLNRRDEAIHPLLPYATPLVAVLFALVAFTVWRSGINRYHSTGS